MSYRKDGNTITMAAELSEEEYSSFLLGYGMTVGSLFEIDKSLGWLFVSILNRFLQGCHNFVPYEVPANRTQPFEPRYVQVVPRPEPPMP